MQTTNNNWNKAKLIPWVWGSSEKKKHYKHRVKKNEEERIKEDVSNFIDLLPWTYFKWPICKICKERNAKYDMFICDMCEQAMDRLKKGE